MQPDRSTVHGAQDENHGGRSLFAFFRKPASSSRSSKRGTHVSRVIRDALDGLPLERFRRICGLFDSVVPPEVKKKNPLAVPKFAELREKINQRLIQKDRIYQAD